MVPRRRQGQWTLGSSLLFSQPQPLKESFTALLLTEKYDQSGVAEGHWAGAYLSPTFLSHPLLPGPAPAGLTPGDPGPRLSHLSVTDVTTSSLRLNWEAPLGAFDSFLLRFGVPSPSTLEPHPRPLLQRELMVPGTRRSAVLRDLRPGTLYSLTLYGLRGPHKADSIQGTARTLSPSKAPCWAPLKWTFVLYGVGPGTSARGRLGSG